MGDSPWYDFSDDMIDWDHEDKDVGYWYGKLRELGQQSRAKDARIAALEAQLAEVKQALTYIKDVKADVPDARYRFFAVCTAEIAFSALETNPPAPKVTETALPQDVIDLVIAAREFWDANDDLSPESRALDKALEEFSSRVPYAEEPDALTAAQESDQ